MEKYELKIDTGSVLIPIIDEKDDEVIGKFKFNPNDLDIVSRYQSVVEKLESIKMPENEDPGAYIAVSNQVKELMDYLLNYNVSEDIFAKCNPFTLTSNGNFFIENVIEGIANIIEKAADVRLKKKKAKIAKATKGYH